MSFLQFRCIIALTLLAACAPAWAQNALSSNPANLTINYKAGDPLTNNSVTFQISPVVPITAHVTVNINSFGVAVSGTDVQGVFSQPSIVMGAGQVSEGILDTNTLSAIANRGAPATYTGELTISASGYSDLKIPLVLNIVTGSNTGPLSATPNPLSISVAVTGQSVSTSLTVRSPSNASFTATAVELSRPDVIWLTVSPNSGSLLANTDFVVTVTGNAAVLPVADYTGRIDIAVAGVGSIQVPVTLHVGTAGTLTLNPGSVTFTYVVGGSIPSAQNVSVSGTTASFYTASPATNSGGNWLLVNGGTSAQSLAINQAAPISVNPVGLGGGTYTGTVAFSTATDSRSANLSVTLQVGSSGSTFSPSSLTFNYVGGVVPASQQLNIFGSGNFSLQATTNSAGNWMSVTPGSGTLPATVTVAILPAGLGQGTYSGTIVAIANGVVLGSVPITLVVGTLPPAATGVAPASLTFTVPSGQNSSTSQPLVVNGDGTSYTAAASSSSLWLSVSPVSGATPATLTVTANPFSLTAGSYTGSVDISTGGSTRSIPVTLNIVAGTLIRANPGAFAFNYQAAGTAPATQNVVVSTSVLGTSLPFTVASNATWIVVTQPTSTSTPGSFSFSIDTNKLSGGLNTSSITITSANAANNPLTIPVTVLATGLASAFLNPLALSLTGALGGAAVSGSANVNPGASASFTAVASSTGNWLSVSPSSGNGPTTLTISASPTGLNAGTYSGTITVTGGGNSQNLTVTFNVSSTTGGAILAVYPATLAFGYRQGDSTPATQQVQVNSGGIPISGSITSNQNWLTVSPASGSTPFASNVSVNPSGLASGTYSGILTVTSSGAVNSPQYVNVTLDVTGAAPSLIVSATSLSFSYRTDGSAPPPQSVSVTSSGGAFSFSVTRSQPWISVTPGSGTTPQSLSVSVNPAGLSPGSYSGTITITSGGLTQTITVSFTVTGVLPTITALVNGASGDAGPIAPGEVVLLTGTAMAGPDLMVNRPTGGVFSSSLGGVRVLFSGIFAPLLYVRSDQIAAIVPYALAGRTSTFAQVEYLDQRSNTVNRNVVPAAPGIFTADSSGSGPVAAFNQDGSLNTANNPANPGSIVVLYLTGEGQTNPPGVDGKVADNPNQLPKPVLPVSALIDNQPAEVLYFGAAPTLVAGAAQANVRVPLSASPNPRPGQVSVVVTVGNGSSQSSATIWVR
jgi:uncharacterized protein (TIGR03437 family)